MQRINDSDKQQQLTELITLIRAAPELNTLYQAVEREVTTRSFGVEMAMETD